MSTVGKTFEVDRGFTIVLHIEHSRAPHNHGSSANWLAVGCTLFQSIVDLQQDHLLPTPSASYQRARKAEMKNETRTSEKECLVRNLSVKNVSL